ncbi:MAG TPA: coniferyl aldehyde dehydrogenase [Spongiibacteraceae bacterium]|nr:coniferyl aldehyde dehydrogenase [Spongiibacteraceae bacterium]
MAQTAQLRGFTEPHSEAQSIFLAQREAYLRQPFIDYAERIANLDKLEALFTDNTDAIAAAIAKDFGHRSAVETKLLEIFGVLSGIRDTRRNLKRWMKPQRRHVSILFASGKNRLVPQPKGIVGIIVPWNYPVFLLGGPLTSALAAGNRCMIKMAANSRNLCALLHDLFSKTFAQDLITIVPNVKGNDFAALPFDHLIFTGSADTGRTVMQSAAENLCPVTLELGGKSPAIIGDDYDLKEAAARLLYTKFINAGQTCVAPDYVFVPELKIDAFVESSRALVGARYADINGTDYTSVIDERSYRRLRETLDDAVAKGARAIKLVDGDFNDELRKFPPHLLLNVSDDMRVMQEEIFGPLLPIKAYRNLDETIDFINRRDRPLGLYLFSNMAAVQEKVLYNTLSGGVTINHCVFHAIQHDMPFGGVGPSGMGHYHGYEGFVEFSKLRPVFTYPKFGKPDLFYPPYTRMHDLLFTLVNKLKL